MNSSTKLQKESIPLIKPRCSTIQGYHQVLHITTTLRSRQSQTPIVVLYNHGYPNFHSLNLINIEGQFLPLSKQNKRCQNLKGRAVSILKLCSISHSQTSIKKKIIHQELLLQYKRIKFFFPLEDQTIKEVQLRGK